MAWSASGSGEPNFGSVCVNTVVNFPAPCCKIAWISFKARWAFGLSPESLLPSVKKKTLVLPTACCFTSASGALKLVP